MWSFVIGCISWHPGIKHTFIGSILQAQFSEEDQVLKDRVDKLIEEINDLQTSHKANSKRLRKKRSSSQQPNSPEHLEQQEKIVVSASEANLVPLNLELNHQLQSEMELHTNCSSESQVIILRVSESEDNLVQLTGSQYQTESPIPKLTTSESDNTQTEIETESPIPMVVISESESSQTGTESPIPVLMLDSEDSQTGSQSPIPTTTNLESETDSQTDTGTECPESKPSRKNELTPAESPLPTIITPASHDSDPDQLGSGTEPGSILTKFASFGEGNGSLPDQESKEYQTLSATYYISCGEHLIGSVSSDASFQSFIEQEHSPLSGTEDVFFGD